MNIDTAKYTRQEIGAMLKLMLQQQEDAEKAYRELSDLYYSGKTVYKDNIMHRITLDDYNDGRQS
jgi:hypothetical protein